MFQTLLSAAKEDARAVINPRIYFLLAVHTTREKNLFMRGSLSKSHDVPRWRRSRRLRPTSEKDSDLRALAKQSLSYSGNAGRDYHRRLYFLDVGFFCFFFFSFLSLSLFLFLFCSRLSFARSRTPFLSFSRVQCQVHRSTFVLRVLTHSGFASSSAIIMPLAQKLIRRCSCLRTTA